MFTQTPETNREIVRKLYEDCINAKRPELLPALVAEDYVGASGETGPTGFAATVADLRKGFPDITFTLEDLIAEGGRVAVRWTWRGTHRGQFRAFAPSGKPLTNTGIAIYEIRNNLITRAWLETDRLGILQQMGVVPFP